MTTATLNNRQYQHAPILSIIQCHDGVKVLRLDPYEQGARPVFEGRHIEEAHDFLEQRQAEAGSHAEVVPSEAMSAELWERRNDRVYGEN